jgi:hypothetical protein
MAFKRHIIVVSERARFRDPKGNAWAHKVGIAVLPFLADTSR